jgi:hypothetical protein
MRFKNIYSLQETQQNIERDAERHCAGQRRRHAIRKFINRKMHHKKDFKN